VITGNGLKDIRSAVQAVGKPYEVAPDLGRLTALIEEKGLA